MKNFHYEKLDDLMKENDEILAIVVASLKTAKLRKRNSSIVTFNQDNPKFKIQNLKSLIDKIFNFID